ncbi:hypothetical protein [Streptosporangium vulgare]
MKEFGIVDALPWVNGFSVGADTNETAGFPRMQATAPPLTAALSRNDPV